MFDQWVKRREPKTAVLVVRRGGKTVFVKGHSADPLQPTLIASLSKAITGACIATLVRDGKFSFTTPLREALAQFFKPFGAPADERLEQVTVEELLVHRAGLRGNADDDPIFGVFDRRADGGSGCAGAKPKPVLAEYLLKDRLARHPGGRYSYSNTGYEILTAVIEEQTGRSYEDYCGEAVFGKLGIAAAEAASRLADAGGRGRLVHSRAGLSGLPRHLRSGASVSWRRRQGLDRPGADAMDARPTATAGTASASTPGPAPAAGRSRMAAS